MPFIAAFLAILIFSPVLIWNAAHGWASFAKQGGRTLVFHPLLALRYLGELIGGQFGLATPLIAIVCSVGIATCVWRWRRSVEGALAALTLPPVLVFLQHALGDRVQANWPAIIYPAAALSVATIGPRCKRLITPAIYLGLGMTGIVYIQAAFHPINLGRADPTGRLRGWKMFAQQVEQIATEHQAEFVAADNYGVAAMLARSPISVPIFGVEPRWRSFDLQRPSEVRGAGLLVTQAGHAPEGWQSTVYLKSLTRAGASYDVYGATGPRDPVVLPR